MRFGSTIVALTIISTLSACAGGSGTTADNEQPAPVEPATAAVPNSGGTAAAPARSLAQHDGLIKLGALAKLPAPTFKSTPGYPGKGFHLGAFTDQAAWQEFQALAQLSLPTVDFDSQIVVYAVLDAQTNGLGFDRFSSADGVGTLEITWAGIEPFYKDATPGVFAVVTRGDLTRIAVRADGSRELGTFELRP